MVKLIAVGVIGTAFLLAQPAAAQDGWVAIPEDGACAVEYPMPHGTYRLRRTISGNQTFRFSFMEDGEIIREKLSAEIKRDYYPDHYIGLSTISRGGFDVISRKTEIITEVVFEIELTEDFLNWMVANTPGYAVKHKGKVIAAFGTYGLADGRRLLDTCKPKSIVRAVNLPPKPLGDRSRWFEIEELQRYLPDVTGRLSIAARLTVGADGLAQNCNVTASTGSHAADEAFCARLKLRSRFKSATGRRGEPVTGVYDYKVTLQLN